MKRSLDAGAQAIEQQQIQETYKPDTHIVVNSNGVWKEVTVTNRPIEVQADGSYKMEILIGGANGILDTYVFEVGQEPEVIVGEELTTDGIVDVEFGATFEVANPTVSPDGHVEYRVTAPDGKVYEHVPQEFLLSWKKTLELEKKVAELEQEIGKVQEDQKSKMQQERLALQLQLQEVYTHLPEVDEMQDVDRNAVEKIKKAIDDIHEATSKAIKEFEEKVLLFEKISTPGVQKKGDELIAEHATPFVDTKYLPDTQYAMGKESAADKERRLKHEKEEYDETKQFAQQLKEQILDEIGKILQEKTHKESQVPRGDAAARVIINTEAENKKRDLHEYIFNQLESAPDGYQKKLWDSLQKKRIDLASRSMMGVIDIPDAPGIPAHKDFSNAGGRDSIMFGKNVELLKSVVEEQLEEYEPKDLSFDPKGKEIFDWEKEKAALQSRIMTLKAKFEENNSEALQIPEKKQQYQTLIGLETDMSAHFQMLQSLDTVPDTALPVDNTNVVQRDIVGLNLARYDYLNTYLSEIRKVEKALQTIDETARKNAEQKQIEDKRTEIENSPEKQKFKGEGIDIPDYELREMLLQHLGGVHSAMELIMRGGVTRGKDGKIEISPDLINQMKGLFGDMPPQKENKTAFDTAQLRKFGIKSWDKFKKLWDSELAEKSIFILNDILTQTFERNIAENTGWWDKMKTHRSKLIGAAVTNFVLVGGSSYGVSRLVTEITKNELVQSVAVATVGGAGSGALKYSLLKKIFGSDKAKEKAAKREQELHDTKQKKVIESILAQLFETDESGVVVAAKPGISGFDSFTRILAHTIRETTVGSETFTDTTGSVTLSGDDLLIYRQKLNALKTKHPDEKMKMELARSIQESSINTQTFEYNGEHISLTGGQLLAYKEYLREYVDSLKPEEKVDETIKAKLAWAIANMKPKEVQDVTAVHDKKYVHNPNVIDTVLSNISGQGTMKGSMITNVGLSGLMMLDPIARTLFGGLVMGRLGTEIGEQLYYKSERTEAVKRVDDLMNAVAIHTNAYRKHKALSPDALFAEKVQFVQEVLSLKRLLHATAPPEDMSAIIYKVKQKGVREKDDEDGSYKKGDPLPPEVRFDNLRYTNIQSLVFEAERENVFLDEEKKKATLESVLKSQQQATEAIAEKQFNRNNKGMKKLWYKGVGFLAGAVVGAAVSVVTGAITKKFLGHGDPVEGQKTLDAFKAGAEAKGQRISEVAAAYVASQQESIPPSGSSAHHDAPPVAPAQPEVAPPAPIEVAKSPDIVADSIGTDKIAKGEGPLHAINRMTAEHDLGMKKSELHTWKMAELERMGIKYENGKWQWGLTVHEGAEIELYTGTDGEPHLRLIGEEGKTITSHDTYRIPSHAVPEKGIGKDVPSGSDTPAQGEKSSPKPGQTKTATVDTKSQNVLDKQQELEKASGKSAGKGQVEKQQARFDKALEEKGGVKEFHGSIRKDGNVMVEFGNGDKQLYPADMLGLSAGENGTLILNIPVDVATPLHSGTVASGGGSGSGSYSVGAKVPEGAKFFVTPDEAVEKTASHIVEQQAREAGGGVVREADVKSDNLQQGKNADTASEATPTKEQLVPVSEQGNSPEMIAKMDSKKTFAVGVQKSFQSFTEQLNSPTVHASSDVMTQIKYKLYTHIRETYYPMAERGEVPVELIDQPNNIDAIKAYMLQDKNLDPVVKLYFGEGTPASLDGAAAVHMAKSTSDSADISPMIKVTMPKGGEYMVGVPEGADSFARDRQGHLVLIKGDDLFAPELDEIDGYPVIRIKGGKTGI